MTTRQTSNEAYRQITNEGLLADMGLKAYAALYHHGPATANELRAAVSIEKQTRNLDKSIHKRLHELRNAGVAREVGKRVCKISGRTCIEWDVTSGLPVKKERPETNAQKAKRLQAELVLIRAEASSLSGYAACVRHDQNQPEWVAGLLERAERMQKLLGIA